MYLLHAVNLRSWQQSALKFDLLTKLEKAREQGKIRYIGFSFHDSFDAFMTVLDGYAHWISARSNTTILMWIIRRAKKVFWKRQSGSGRDCHGAAARRQACRRAGECARGAAGWFSRAGGAGFCVDRPETSLLLSGMSNTQQLQENLRFAHESRPNKLTQADKAKFAQAREILQSAARVNCTRCEYCLPCPKGVKIPEVFALYNRSVMDADGAKKAYGKLKGNARSCVQCGKCETKCPQQLPIRRLLAEAHTALGGKG